VTSARVEAKCCYCRHFRNDPAFLEATFKGLNALSSADASVRGDDGLCLLHGRILSAEASCAAFAPATVAAKNQER